MTAEEFRDEVIRIGIESVHKHEDRKFRRDGCLEGFRIARELLTLQDFEERIGSLNEKLEAIREGEHDAETYWYHRCLVAQVEHVYQRMRAFHGVYPLSGNAYMQMAEIVSGKSKEDLIRWAEREIAKNVPE